MGEQPEPRIVYAVTYSDWDDFGVCALFEREADARAAMAAGLGDDSRGADVTEYTLFPAGVVPKRFEYWRAVVKVLPDGREFDPSDMRHTDWEGVDGASPPVEPRVGVERSGITGWWVAVDALTREKALDVRAAEVAKLQAEAVESGAVKAAENTQRLAVLRERHGGNRRG